MRRAIVDIDRLVGELRLDAALLASQLETNARAHARILNGANDILDYAALGFTIHNIYGIAENACECVIRFFENDMPTEFAKRYLLERMIVDVPRLRPPFLSQVAYGYLDDLRCFRDTYRSLHCRELDTENVQAIQRKVPDAVETFRKSLETFFEFLEGLRAGLKE